MLVAGHIELARRISSDVGMEFRSETGMESNGDRWVRLAPVAVSVGRAFDVKVQMTWRRLRLAFEPQKFAGDLVRSMGQADESARTVFRTVLAESVARGAAVRFNVNGSPTELDDQAVWRKRWRRLDLRMSKRLARLDGATSPEELNLVHRWACRFVAAVLAIAPLEGQPSVEEVVLEGSEEGAPRVGQTVRYERNRRNRAAAIAIHGTACLACGLEFGARYGRVAEGFIEVHHTVPVARMSRGYIVDPIRDLVPLCPNCHAVAHRRDPPLTVDEVKGLLREA